MAPHTPGVLRFGKLSKKPVAPAGYKNKQTSVLSSHTMTAYVPLRSATERERVAFLIPHPGYGDISLFIVHRNLLQILHGFQDLITADVDDGAAGSFNVLSGNGNPSDVIILRDLIHDI